MNYAVRCVRVQPVNAPRGLRNPDELRNLDGLTAIVDREMLMDVEALTFAGIARDAFDGTPHELVGALGLKR